MGSIEPRSNPAGFLFGRSLLGGMKPVRTVHPGGKSYLITFLGPMSLPIALPIIISEANTDFRQIYLLFRSIY